MCVIDLRVVFDLQPDCKEATELLFSIKALEGTPDGWGVDNDEDPSDLMAPLPDDSTDEPVTPVASDSEDYTHDGYGVPCKHYNHDGCRMGSKCSYKHAPDGRSVRDDL